MYPDRASLRSMMFRPAFDHSRRLLLCLAIAGSCSAVHAAVTPQQLAENKEKLAKAYDELAAADSRVPRESFDPAAVLEAEGRDPAALLAWVKKNVQPLPYSGALKGVSGTMLDRAGSSLDRTLLLAELLKQSGNEVRLAYSKTGGAAPSIEVPKAAPSNSPAAAARERVTGTIAKLSPLVPLRPAGASVSSEHWWVQIKDGEKCTDVDLDGNGGTPEQTFRYDSAENLQLPSEMLHAVDYTIVVEQWAGGKLTESKVTTGQVRLAEHVGQIVRLRHMPVVKGPLASAGQDQALAKKLVLEQHEWMPILDLPSGRAAKQSFTDAGAVVASPELGKAGAASKLGGAMFGGMGGNVGGQETKDASNPDTILTAEWLDVTIKTPGQPDRTLRREIFDLIGPAARIAGVSTKPALSDDQKFQRGLAILGVVESLPLGSSLSRNFVLHSTYQAELNTKDVWMSALSEPDTTKRRQKFVARIDNGSPLTWFAIARDEVSPVDGQTYIASPNVVNTIFKLVVNEKGSLTGRRIVDVVANAVQPRKAGDLAAVLAQGVADTAAESAVLKVDDKLSDNTFNLFDAAPAGSKLVALKTEADLRAAKLPLPADTLVRIGEDLKAGYAVVMFDKAIPFAGNDRSGWWRVRPDTGEAVGVMDTGYHQDTTEYIEDTYISGEADTLQGFYRGGGGNNSLFWKRHARTIAQELGYDPTDMTILNRILDIQWGMFESGVWI